MQSESLVPLVFVLTVSPLRADNKDRMLFSFDKAEAAKSLSYPNLVPLPSSTVRRIAAAVEPFEFDRIYGAWWGKVVVTDAKATVHRSADRYIRALQDER